MISTCFKGHLPLVLDRRTVSGCCARSSADTSFTGRGALSNPPGRFDLQHFSTVDDGWYVEEEPDSVATTLEPERAKEIITENDSPDVPFERRSIRIGDAVTAAFFATRRPSHAYMGLSPGLDFETRIFYKQDAAKCWKRSSRVRAMSASRSP